MAQSIVYKLRDRGYYDLNAEQLEALVDEKPQLKHLFEFLTEDQWLQPKYSVGLEQAFDEEERRSPTLERTARVKSMLGLGREEGVAGLERREMRESTLKRLDEEEMELCEREIERLQAELAAEEQASAEWLEIDGDRAALVS